MATSDALRRDEARGEDRAVSARAVREGAGGQGELGPRVEVEVKLRSTDRRIAEQLVELGQLGPYRIRDRGADHLQTTYLDTRDFSLARAGLVLRLRSSAAGSFASIKWMGQSSGVLHERPELEVKLPRVPPLPWRNLPRELVPYVAVYQAGRALGAVLVTRVVRHTLEVVRNGSGRRSDVVAEIACDQVEITAPGKGPRPLAYDEIEVEQRRGGSAEELMEIASVLVRHFHLHGSDGSKFETGMRYFYPARLWQAGLDRVAARKRGAAWNLWRAADVEFRLGRDTALRDLLVGVCGVLHHRPAAKGGAALERELAWLVTQVATLVGLQAASVGNADDPSRRLLAAAVQQRYARLRRELLRLLDSPRYWGLVRRCEREMRGD